MAWERLPVLLPAVFFLLGTLLSIGAVPVAPGAVLLAATAGLVLAVGAYAKKRPLFFSAFLCSGFCLAGLYFVRAAEERRELEKNGLRPYLEEEAVPEWTAGLCKDPEEAADHLTLLLQLESVQRKESVRALHSRCRLVVYHGDGPEAGGRWRAGDRIRFRAALRFPRNFSNPGMFDYRAFLERQDILLIGTLKTPAQLERLPGRSGSAFERYAASMRRAFTGFLRSSFSPYGPEGQRTSAILEGLLFGGREKMEPAVEELFQKTGTYHIFVVSGFNTALIAVFLAGLIRLFTPSRLAAFPVSVLALGGYAVMADMNVPVIRATLLCLFVLAARCLWRRIHLLNSLAITAILILVLWPESARDASFQLTYLACLAIACIAVPLTRRLLDPFRLAVRGIFQPNVSLVEPGPVPRMARRLRYEIELAVDGCIQHLRGDPERGRRLAAVGIAALGSAGYYLAGILLVSISVQLFMAPVMAVLFHRVTLASALANLVVVPVMTVLLISSLVIGLAGTVLGWTWSAWVPLTMQVCRWVLDSLEWFSRWPYWHWWVTAPPTAWIWLYFGLWIPVLLPLPRTIRLASLAAALLLLPTFFWSPFPLQHQAGRLEAWFLDVGHGDSILLIFPDGRTMLVDGGGQWRPPAGDGLEKEAPLTRFDIGQDVVCPALWTLRVRKLDYVLLTHPERDHAGGLEAVLRHFPVGELLGPSPVQKWQGLLPVLSALAKEKEISWKGVLRGQAFQVGAAEIRILNPPASLLGPHSRVNNRSVVLYSRYGKQKILLTGDVEKATEFDLLRECHLLQTDLLKVAHHGSDTSTTAGFLDCASPRYAVISGSDGPSAHRPSRKVIDRIKERGIQCFTTWEHGAVHAVLSPDSMEVSSFLKATIP